MGLGFDSSVAVAEEEEGPLLEKEGNFFEAANLGDDAVEIELATVPPRLDGVGVNVVKIIWTSLD